MMPFNLKIVTPDGLFFDGQAEQLIVRTITGDIGIMARHMNYLSPLGMGRAVVITEGKRRTAACIGGMVSVMNGEVTLMPTTFEWAEDIDLDRANRSSDQAQSVLQSKNTDKIARSMAEARLRRALIRQSVANNK